MTREIQVVSDRQRDEAAMLKSSGELHHEMQIHSGDHTPWNKHRWQIERSHATLFVQDWPATVAGKNPDAHISIRLQEVTQAKAGGPVQERNIAVTLGAEARKALLEYLSDSLGYELKLKDRQSEQKAL